MFKIKKMPDEGMFGVYRGNQLIKAGTKTDVNLFISQTQSKPKEFANQFHCLSSCTECCQQHVSVSQIEIFRIRRYIRKMDITEVQHLKNQERDKNFCPLLDIEKGLCSVYEARPEICKAFGQYNGVMCCSYNMDVPLRSVEKHFASMIQNSEPLTGRLGIDFTWDKGLVR